MKKYTILAVHNHYQIRGGEDSVFESECAMLEKAGHRVVRCELSNDGIDGNAGLLKKIGLFFSTVWSRSACRQIRELIRREKPDVMHCQNTFPRFSPGIYWTAKAEGVPVVQTLHNYRLACLNGYLLRDGSVCETCLGRCPLPGVKRRCYRNSLGASATVAAMLWAHRLLGTYRKKVDAYLVLADFSRSLFVRAGLPEEKLFVKPNVVEAPPRKEVKKHAENDVLRVFCAARLSSEKGVDVLVKAWLELVPGLRNAGIAAELRIAGAGPEEAALKALSQGEDTITFLGMISRDACFEEMQHAAVIAYPSICYETFCLSLVEASAYGIPVVASALGVAGSFVREGYNGLRFPAGDVHALASALEKLLTDAPLRMTMARNARQFYLENDFSEEKNLHRLLSVYHHICAS